MTPVTACISSGMHIQEGETLVEVPDGWAGELVDIFAECPMCSSRLRLTVLCTCGSVLGFHWPEHDA